MKAVKLIYTCAPGEGPETKHLLRHNMHVTPGQAWECSRLEFAHQLIQEYPQINAADEASQKILFPPAEEPKATKATKNKEVKAGE